MIFFKFFYCLFLFFFKYRNKYHIMDFILQYCGIVIFRRRSVPSSDSCCIVWFSGAFSSWDFGPDLFAVEGILSFITDMCI